MLSCDSAQLLQGYEHGPLSLSGGGGGARVGPRGRQMMNVGSRGYPRPSVTQDILWDRVPTIGAEGRSGRHKKSINAASNTALGGGKNHKMCTKIVRLPCLVFVINDTNVTPIPKSIEI